MLEFDHLFDTTLASLRKLLRRFVQENLATEGRGGGVRGQVLGGGSSRRKV